jgi:hypothetical protein
MNGRDGEVHQCPYPSSLSHSLRQLVPSSGNGKMKDLRQLYYEIPADSVMNMKRTLL